MREVGDGDVCATCRHRAQGGAAGGDAAGGSEHELPLRLAMMLAWSKVLHGRLAEESVVPHDLEMSIVERINDQVVRTKLPGETFGEFFAFRGKWSGRLPRSRADCEGRLVTSREATLSAPGAGRADAFSVVPDRSLAHARSSELEQLLLAPQSELEQLPPFKLKALAQAAGVYDAFAFDNSAAGRAKTIKLIMAQEAEAEPGTKALDVSDIVLTEPDGSAAPVAKSPQARRRGGKEEAVRKERCTIM